jgi:hypothetical protein
MGNIMEMNPYKSPRSKVLANPIREAGPPALWNPDVAGLWSLLFTPTFGSYLLWKNCLEMGDIERSRTAKKWLIVSAVMILPTRFIPFSGFLYIIIWYFFFQKKQAKHVESTWGKNISVKVGQSLC